MSKKQNKTKQNKTKQNKTKQNKTKQNKTKQNKTKQNKTKQNIVIVGSSGHAKVIIDIIEKEEKYKIVGLLDAFKNIGESAFRYEILGEEKDLPKLIKKYQLTGCVIAIGDNWIRNIVKNKIREIDASFNFINTIHPSAIIARGVAVGSGTVIMAGTVINSNSKIGDFCIINTNASLDHDNNISDFSSIAPGVTTGGNVTMGEFTTVSLGANIIHGITIGKHSVIGTGSTVLKNVGDYVVAYGTPAKIIRKRKEGDKYL